MKMETIRGAPVFSLRLGWLLFAVSPLRVDFFIFLGPRKHLESLCLLLVYKIERGNFDLRLISRILLELFWRRR